MKEQDVTIEYTKEAYRPSIPKKMLTYAAAAAFFIGLAAWNIHCNFSAINMKHEGMARMIAEMMSHAWGILTAAQLSAVALSYRVEGAAFNTHSKMLAILAWLLSTLSTIIGITQGYHDLSATQMSGAFALFFGWVSIFSNIFSSLWSVYHADGVYDSNAWRNIFSFRDLRTGLVAYLDGTQLAVLQEFLRDENVALSEGTANLVKQSKGRLALRRDECQDLQRAIGEKREHSELSNRFDQSGVASIINKGASSQAWVEHWGLAMKEYGSNISFFGSPCSGCNEVLSSDDEEENREKERLIK